MDVESVRSDAAHGDLLGGLGRHRVRGRREDHPDGGSRPEAGGSLLDAAGRRPPRRRRPGHQRARPGHAGGLPERHVPAAQDGLHGPAGQRHGLTQHRELGSRFRRVIFDSFEKESCVVLERKSSSSPPPSSHSFFLKSPCYFFGDT